MMGNEISNQLSVSVQTGEKLDLLLSITHFMENISIFFFRSGVCNLATNQTARFQRDM